MIYRLKVAELHQAGGDLDLAKVFYRKALESAVSNRYVPGIDEALEKLLAR